MNMLVARVCTVLVIGGIIGSLGLDEARLLSQEAKHAAAQEMPVRADPATEDFRMRCQASGVIRCVGFDSQSEVAPQLYPAWDQNLRGFVDEGIRTSGKGSLRFDIPPFSPANTSGYFTLRFGQNFEEGETFYVQFRQRFSPEMLAIDWAGLMGTSWKQVIFHNHSATCGDLELTTAMYEWAKPAIPIMYTDCGARALYSNGGKPPTQLQQGDYNCWYGHVSPKSCFAYLADQWVTLYYQVSIGEWGKPNSTIKAWVALGGKPYRQWIDMRTFALNNSTPGRGYDSVTLLPYMTGKNPTVSHPTAHTWYDELIVSTEPIAAPGSSSSSARSAGKSTDR